ncbi:PTS-dependent dihydroxyacetone kinase phosphotransferase subunit DhaM [Virgibacillus dakarensis]|uniref:phosphoenolpyruvate--glycerone phosphotransferase n=1 Tax=Lentibacillus populi TaxID=1827502 RepID=A0A9W5X4X2_9BACI|nr:MULTISPECIES: dihydroxyacetone kinase phosphoryl donor subunit DhaM [Bacillaceae]MBT2218194.1 PTS-dependent dihydroxyacetone kinase phosphotransferase subunit DhaM [Virgibacillus dakarensis]MTW87966.1 PTS-dependent dihydroxyacetone kinase phosphotransferase subunit DhaM [Virgibacillus dakarensis]GGB37688.1 PTS-dependent dihydroxyacetone kinase phosphotransferase subunit DhaM [Lentibacillus populi]
MAYAGIVLISHSPKVVEGIKDIIRQVNQDVAIELAGGTDDNQIGTSIDKILKAIERADEGKGVLLVYDLGSAKMNAEMAVEMTDREHIKIVEAPLIEGAYVASVEAGMGKSVDEIIATLEREF